MKLSLRWYSTNYSKGFHIYHCILSKCPSKYQSIWLTACQSTEANNRPFDSSKYLTTLRSNISPCQKATTLILIPLYKSSFHLRKPSRILWELPYFCLGCFFKICDRDKLLSTTPVTQFWLQPVTWPNKLIQDDWSRELKNVKNFRVFYRNGKFHV